MTLKEACKKVIGQNKSMGCHPEIFIFQTKGCGAIDLNYKVSNLVKSQTAFNAVIEAIEKYGDILTIEDLIVENEDGFGLPQDIINKAKQNAEAFEWRRNLNSK